MRWGDPVPRVPINAKNAVIDMIDGLGWDLAVGAAFDPEVTNATAPEHLPFVGVALDGRGGNQVVAGLLVRVQVWGDPHQPTALEDLQARLEAALTQGGVAVPAGIVGIHPVAFYAPIEDKRTGLLVGSFTVRIDAHVSEPI